MNDHLYASPGHSTPQQESIPNSAGETVDSQEIQPEMMDSKGHLNTHVYGASAGDAHDMLDIVELRKKMASAHGNNSDQCAQKLGSLRQEAQKIAEDKECEEAALFRLQLACSRSMGEYNDIQRQFNNVLDDLKHKL
ncbi:unnamed protein product [Urochloa humidicola]